MERHENLPIDTDWFLDRIKMRDLSMNRTARLMGIDPGNLCRMLHGQSAIALSLVEPLADILGVDVATIVRKATRARETKRKTG